MHRHTPAPAATAAGLALATLVTAAPLRAQIPEACSDRSLPPDAGVVTGTIVAAGNGMPLQKAGVEISWFENGRRSQPLEAETDSTGVYTICTARAGTDLRVQGLYLGERVTEEGRVEAGQVTRVDLTMEAAGHRVAGRVLARGTGEPLEGAAVRLVGTPAQALSAGDGQFFFEGVPAGVYHVTASHIGYPEVTSRFAVNVGERVSLTLHMSEQPIELDPLEVDVRTQRLEEVGFYERRERGRGVYLTKEQIQAKQPHIPSDALRGIAGVTILPSGFGPMQRVTGRGGCPFRYYVNGGRAGDNFMIDELPKESLEAIEVYRGLTSVPPEYIPALGSANAACGVILVWQTNAAHDFRRR